VKADLDVVIVGPVAPPLGGISAHVERLAELLEREGLRVGIVDHFGNRGHPRVIATLRRNPLRYWWEMRRLQARVVHYHHSRWSTLVATGLARRARRGTWIATVHGHELERSLSSRLPWVKWLGYWALGRFDQLIAVSDAVAETIVRPGGPPVAVIPAYLPPSEPYARLDDAVDGPPTALLSAYKVASRPSDDLYGLDIAGVILACACAQIPDLRCELFLSRGPAGHAERQYLERVLQPLRDTAADRVHVYVEARLPPAFRPGAVYLRPTRTDGDAVSIREALDCGVPVVASDVVTRPDGVMPLPLSDTQAWVDAISDAVGRARGEHQMTGSNSAYADALISLYRDTLNSMSAHENLTNA